nr:ATP-binding cassette domain-containing protein [Gordonia hydrophobica]
MGHRSLGGNNLSYHYSSGVEPLKDVTVDLTGGLRTALLGANGSGKTTLLRILAGSLAPAGGQVTVDGVPLQQDRRGLRSHRQTVQLVLQNPDDQLFSADVSHDIAFGPANLGLTPHEIMERVQETLSLLALEELAQRPTHELSYGERKRVTIAGAMAMKPCLLLLDEPTAGLDPAGVEEMFDALERLEQSGTTVILSTHDTSLAFGWADCVSVLESGYAHQGSTSAIFRDLELLQRARLRPPWPVDLMRELTSRTGIAEGRQVPRNAPDFARWIDEALARRPTQSGSQGGAR